MIPSCKRCKGSGEEPPAKDMEPKRRRKRVPILVPDDEQENGAEVLMTLVEEVRKDLGRPEDTPPYYVLCDALAFVLSSEKAPWEGRE